MSRRDSSQSYGRGETCVFHMFRKGKERTWIWHLSNHIFLRSIEQNRCLFFPVSFFLLPFFLASFLSCFLSFLLPFFLASFLSCFLSFLIPFFLTSFLPSFFFLFIRLGSFWFLTRFTPQVIIDRPVSQAIQQLVLYNRQSLVPLIP